MPEPHRSPLPGHHYFLTANAIRYNLVEVVYAAQHYSQAVGAFALAIQALTVAVTLLVNRLAADRLQAIVMF
jgi:hypothetical protein